MDPLRTRPLTRQQISEFVSSPRGVRAFEAAQADITSQNEAITTASFLTVTSEPSLGSERTLTPVAGEIVGTDLGANNHYTLGLADTTVVAGPYGDATHFVTLTVDEKGRITDIATHPAAGAANGSTEIDFGATPADGATVVAVVPGVTASSVVNAWIMASDTTADNDATMHTQAAIAFRLAPSAGTDQITIDAMSMIGFATGKFKIRYSYQ